MARSTPTPAGEADIPPEPSVEQGSEPTSGDGQGAAGGDGASAPEPPAAASEPEPEPGEPTVVPDLDRDVLGLGREPEAEADPPDLPDPLHLIGDRPCPVCEGAGTIPFGVLQSPRFRPCEECGGIGQVLTGSLKTESSVFDCPGCNGQGYKEVPQAGDRPPAAGSVGPEGPPPWPGAEYDHVAGSWR